MTEHFAVDSESIKETWLTTATEVLEFRKKRHRAWFDESDVSILELVANKNGAYNSYIAHPTNHTRPKWKELKAEHRRETGPLKD